jgi:hypothetical protein
MTSTYLPPQDQAAYLDEAAKQALAITEEAVQWTVIQIALMAAQRAVRGSITDMQEKLADRRMVMAEKALAHAQATWPKEAAFLADVFAEGEHTADYTTVPAVGPEVDRTEGLGQDYLDNLLTRQGLAFSACDQYRGERATAQARTDLVGHAMRSAEARSIALNDRRYSRQLAALGLSRGRLANGLTFNNLTAGADAVRSSLYRTVNSGMELWGYTTNRWTNSASFVTPTRTPPMPVDYNRPVWGGWQEPQAPMPVEVTVQNIRDEDTRQEVAF